MDELPPLDHKTPPQTVREIGIHLIYMSKSQAEMNKKLDDMTGTFARKQELTDAINQRKADMSVFKDEFNGYCKRISDIDDTLNKKADLKSLNSLSNKLWSVVLCVISGFIGLVVYLIKGN